MMLEPEHWMNRHGDFLFRYARRRLQSDSQAEDAVQEALLAAWRVRETFRSDSTERTWLTGILKFKVLDTLREAMKVEAPPQDDAGQDDWDALFHPAGHWAEGVRHWGNPHAELERSRLNQAIQDCIDRLKPAMARVFALLELEGMSTEECCQVLDITPTNLWVRLHRAKMSLRACLDVRI
jgi:RNA polymerase sigma-70 factor (ECF subfamily)